MELLMALFCPPPSINFTKGRGSGDDARPSSPQTNLQRQKNFADGVLRFVFSSPVATIDLAAPPPPPAPPPAACLSQPAGFQRPGDSNGLSRRRTFFLGRHMTNCSQNVPPRRSLFDFCGRADKFSLRSARLPLGDRGRQLITAHQFYFPRRSRP